MHLLYLVSSRSCQSVGFLHSWRIWRYVPLSQGTNSSKYLLKNDILSKFVPQLSQVFQRERLNGHYGVTAFVISNTLSAMPFLILITFLAGTVCYYMVRLHPGFKHYLFFVLCLYASVTVVESLMMAIASIVPNFLMGIIIGAGIQVCITEDSSIAWL